MRLPDTVLPDGLDAYETQEAYRALKGHALRIEIYAEDGSAAAANPYTVTEQNFTVRLRAASGPEPARGVLRPPARDADLPLRASRGRPARQPRADPGDRRLRQRAAERLGRLPAPRRATRRRNRRCPPPRRRCSPTTRPGCTSGGPSTGTPTPSTTWRPGRTPTGPRWPAPSTRPRSPASAAAGAGGRDHEPVHVRRHRRAPAGSGPRPGTGRRHPLRAGSRLRHRRDRGPGRRADPAVRRAAAGPLPRRRPDGAARAR